MARPLRIQFAGALYHVTARGNARQAIFRDDDDRQAFIDNLGRVCERYSWRIWAWCLMENLFRLLLETAQATLSRGMREVNGVSTQAFNQRHRRDGHVLQGCYKAVLVDEPDATTGCTGSFASGRLTRMTDASGSTSYCYDRFGRLTQKRQTTRSVPCSP
jgi:YD repeat-containing protein